MRNLLSLLTKMMTSTFHAFVRSRLRAEMGDPEFTLTRDSAEATVENKPAPKRLPQVRESPAAPVPWMESSDFNLPIIGIL